MDIQIQKKHYLIPRKYWGWIAGGIVLVGVLVALADRIREIGKGEEDAYRNY